jgi:hypothetical protein
MGSDMLHYTDLTHFDGHIVPWWHVAIPARYFAMAWEFQNGQHYLCRGVSTGIGAINSTTLI